MEFNTYQEEAKKFAHYPVMTDNYPSIGNLVYPVIALTGEAGELANKLKKLIRNSATVAPAKWINEEVKELLMDELGDVLWYVAATATELGVNLSQVAQHNLRKLEERYGKQNCDNR
jgi:NTP pyrophosphatase (non-canonical NTP hydrolase)